MLRRGRYMRHATRLVAALCAGDKEVVIVTGATPAKNTANAAGALRNALAARNTLDILMYTWDTLLHYPHGANAGRDLAGVAPVVIVTGPWVGLGF